MMNIKKLCTYIAGLLTAFILWGPIGGRISGNRRSRGHEPCCRSTDEVHFDDAAY